MRKTTVEFEGQSFTLGSFTIKDVKYYWNKQNPVTAENVETHTNIYLCDALNRGLGDASNPWTPEKLEASIDLPTRNFLIDAVMKFNGLRRQGGAEGEAPADVAEPADGKVAPWPTTLSGSAAVSSPA